ncbi:hypothetical protein [Sphingomonas sp. PP-CE-1G-424]|uniref:hypothetical protein n=1 Tax=Sphingomonas sp. PP-CE-1G-424 TaxID=2135658 RepID=UPI0010546B7D|nr:hypothetical protein [Sphingomonas sp. PP-CE-1G-424]
MALVGRAPHQTSGPLMWARSTGTAQRAACHSAKAAACVGHRSLSAAGDSVHRVQIGASQVPLRLVDVFQSQASVAGRPQAHRCRRRVPQTIAEPPPGRVTRSQAMASPEADLPGACGGLLRPRLCAAN